MNKKRYEQDAPISVRLIPVIRAKFDSFLKDGYKANHQVNLALAMFYGIPTELVIPHFRRMQNKEYDQLDEMEKPK